MSLCQIKFTSNPVSDVLHSLTAFVEQLESGEKTCSGRSCVIMKAEQVCTREVGSP